MFGFPIRDRDSLASRRQRLRRAKQLVVATSHWSRPLTRFQTVGWYRASNDSARMRARFHMRVRTERRTCARIHRGRYRHKGPRRETRTAMVSGSRGKRGIENNAHRAAPWPKFETAGASRRDGWNERICDLARNLRFNVIPGIALWLITCPDFYHWYLNYCYFRVRDGITVESSRQLGSPISRTNPTCVYSRICPRNGFPSKCRKKYLPIGKRPKNVSERIISYSVRAITKDNICE